MLTFYNIADPTEAVDALTQRLVKELAARQRVLWLVPGGSNIPLVVQVMRTIPEASYPSLAIMLTDERYGPFGHDDSNMFQLYAAGLNTGAVTVVPVLMAEPASLEATCERYHQAVETALANASVVIGQFGMGADGHIAGVLPGSPAVASKKLVAGYDAGNFVRITLTPKALQQVSAGYVFAYGAEKRSALENLRDKKLPLTKQPAQVLKRLPEAYVYNDQIEGTAQ